MCNEKSMSDRTLVTGLFLFCGLVLMAVGVTIALAAVGFVVLHQPDSAGELFKYFASMLVGGFVSMLISGLIASSKEE